MKYKIKKLVGEAPADPIQQAFDVVEEVVTADPITSTNDEAYHLNGSEAIRMLEGRYFSSFDEWQKAFVAFLFVIGTKYAISRSTRHNDNLRYRNIVYTCCCPGYHSLKQMLLFPF